MSFRVGPWNPEHCFPEQALANMWQEASVLARSFPQHPECFSFSDNNVPNKPIYTLPQQVQWIHLKNAGHVCKWLLSKTLLIYCIFTCRLQVTPSKWNFGKRSYYLTICDHFVSKQTFKH